MVNELPINNTNMQNKKVELFIEQLKQTQTRVNPPENLLSETLDKIPVTNNSNTRITSVENFMDKVVTNFRNMQKSLNIPWKVVLPAGILALIMAVFILNSYKPSTNLPTSEDNTVATTQTTVNNDIQKPTGDIDETINAILSYSTDTSEAIAENESSEVYQIDLEISNAYAEQYENTIL